MGGAKSKLKFDEKVDAQLKKTDWSKVAPSREPIFPASDDDDSAKLPVNPSPAVVEDGGRPEESKQILDRHITLVQQSIGNKRRFDVYDDDTQELIFQTRPLLAGILAFGLVGTTRSTATAETGDSSSSSNSKDGDILLVVHTNPSHRKWTICASEPTYEGQEKFPLRGRDKSFEDMPHRYRRALVEVEEDRFSCTARLYGTFDPKATATSMHAEFKCGKLKDPPLLSATKLYGPRGHWTSQIDETVVSYWTWDSSIEALWGQKNKIKMRLAPGTDVTLHVIVALIMNMIHADQMMGTN